MSVTYNELSEELLRRISNKGSYLLTRDVGINKPWAVIKDNHIYPSTSTRPTDISRVSIEAGITTLSGFEYTGNKAGYRNATTTHNTNLFIDTGSRSKVVIKEPIGKEYLVLNEFVRGIGDQMVYKYFPVNLSTTYLPSLTTWYVNTSNQPNIRVDYPMDMYLFPSNALDWEVVWTMGTNEMTHPFLPNFLFTGLVVCVGQHKNIMYEYTDIKGAYGRVFDLFLSSLRPIGLDYPLGFPRTSMLQRDTCYPGLIGEYPKEGLLERDLGGYTGLVTTSLYHPIHKFYLYMRSNYTLFLSSRIPYKGIKNYVLGRREALGWVRDPFTITTPTIPPINEIRDGGVKQYILQYKLHEL